MCSHSARSPPLYNSPHGRRTYSLDCFHTGRDSGARLMALMLIDSIWSSLQISNKLRDGARCTQCFPFVCNQLLQRRSAGFTLLEGRQRISFSLSIDGPRGPTKCSVNAIDYRRTDRQGGDLPQGGGRRRANRCVSMPLLCFIKLIFGKVCFCASAICRRLHYIL